MNSVIKEQVLREKRSFDALGLKYFSSIDTEVTGFVSCQLMGIKTKANVARRTISFQQAISTSAKDITIFGDEYLNRILEVFNHAKYMVAYPGNLSFACNVTFMVDPETKKVQTNSGKVEHYKLPQQITELAPMFLGHEHLHALKETNYQEYVNSQRLADVIPLFYELVMANGKYQDIYDIWLNSRMYLLCDLQNQYNIARKLMKNNGSERDMYKIIAVKNGEYLNSFYYALILYNMYLNDKKLIISLIKKVLNHEMTTIQLLNTLGIYGIDSHQIFEDELNKLKKNL